MFLVEFSLVPTGVVEKIPVALKAPEFLPLKGKVTASIYLRGHKSGEKHVEIKITYTLNRNLPVVSIKKELIRLPFVQPFEVKTKFLSMLMADVKKVYVGESFGVMPTVHCISPWPIHIETTYLDFVSCGNWACRRKLLDLLQLPPVQSYETQSASQIGGHVLECNEVGAELYLAICDKPSDQNVQIGQYNIKWKRY